MRSAAHLQPAPALLAALIAATATAGTATAGTGIAGVTFAGVLVTAPAALAQPERPAPPPARPVIQEPDRESCRPEAIQRGFRQQLLPWADQPEAVQARLRQLQGELTGRSLSRCVAKGLLTAQQARELAASLGLAVAPQPAPAPGTGAPSGSGARP